MGNGLDYECIIPIVIALLLIIFIYGMIEWDNMYGSCNTSNTVEPYITSYFRRKYGKYCNNCGELGRKKCNDCINCGYCYDPKGFGQCVPGDENGPFFREDCHDYEYRQPKYYTYIYPSFFRYPFFNRRHRYDSLWRRRRRFDRHSDRHSDWRTRSES